MYFVDLIRQAGGSSFHFHEALAYAEHTFESSEVDPIHATQMITEIQYIENHLKGSDYQVVKKENPYLGVVASPGCGKSHLLDWLSKWTSKGSEPKRGILCLTFNTC